jgi:hypothetical protein
MAASEGNKADTNSKYTPQLGMEFKTKGDASTFSTSTHTLLVLKQW